MKNILLFSAFFVLLTFTGVAQKFKLATIAFYNTENLYDTIDQPNVDDTEFTPGAPSKWNTARYQLKIQHLSEVMSKIGIEQVGELPLAIGLAEVENRGVVEDLIKSPALKSANYGIVHFDSPDKRGIDVALIYRQDLFKVTATHKAPLKVDSLPNFLTRDQLVVSGIFDNKPLHFIVNHWPSRMGGEERSAPLRNAAARLCRSLADSLMKIDPKAKIIIMGDLNDDPTNESISKYLKAKANEQDTHRGDLFDPMIKLFADGNGTLEYKGKWNLFDQFIVSSGLVKASKKEYHYSAAKIYKEPYLLEQEGKYKGTPWRTYAGTKYLGGYSDHLPSYILIEKKSR
ncbi:MAG: endonuclease/exonuclease/phosphatase family protein [Bacteroidetes bacterium]|nr:endonuclease/exonuclease/phosphatase family protein [Bacteroidota bacterium]